MQWRRPTKKELFFLFFLCLIIPSIFILTIFKSGAYSCATYFKDTCYFYNNFNQLCHCEQGNIILTNEMITQFNKEQRETHPYFEGALSNLEFESLKNLTFISDNDTIK